MLNLLRIWGGGITLPDGVVTLADRYGLMVWSDLWVTGDTPGEISRDDLIFRSKAMFSRPIWRVQFIVSLTMQVFCFGPAVMKGMPGRSCMMP